MIITPNWWSCFISIASPTRVSVWLVPSAFSLVIKGLLCLNPTLQSALDPLPSGYCRWLPCTINFSFSPGSAPSADMLTSSHTKTLSFFDFSSHSCHQLNLLFFIAKFLKRVAPNYSPLSHLQIPTSFYPPVKITMVKVSNNHHLMKSNGYCGIHLAWPIGEIW